MFGQVTVIPACLNFLDGAFGVASVAQTLCLQTSKGIKYWLDHAIKHNRPIASVRNENREFCFSLGAPTDRRHGHCCGAICGAGDWVEEEEFGRSTQKWLGESA